MSYGWLTESALLPKPSKQIVVDGSSSVDLKVMLMNEKAKRTANVAEGPKKGKKLGVLEKANPKVQERSHRDLEAQKNIERAKQTLEDKVAMYDSLTKLGGARSAGLLIDFEGKRIDSMTTDERDRFEKEVDGLLEHLKAKTQKIEENIVRRTGFAAEIDRMNREREVWEREELRDIEQGKVTFDKAEKPLVLQNYDNRVSAEEKKELSAVIVESKAEKDKLTELKKRRQEVQDQRRAKLKKIEDSIVNVARMPPE
eukprot:TRINITY_DN3610_c0_g1_i1.p1 TRINITY_DN3610_c0_g1~~TRINITY_DN3610_c0_g1_i1.p1  ORF type:complete len:256 (+),score=80.39 TRINITY_DN3610_c0_g1_i1:105-872(+)